MRGRHTLAIVQLLGLDEATGSVDERVQLAVSLAKDERVRGDDDRRAQKFALSLRLR
jgi:hypothetical protein